MNDMEDDIAAAMQEVSGGAAESTGGAGGTPGSTGDAGGDAPVAPTVESSPSNADKGGPVESAATKRARDDKGRFAPGSPEAKAAEAVAAKAAPAVKPTPPVQAAAAPVPPVVTPAAALKAPQSWTPAAREHFAKLPPEVQAEVARREREIATALQDSAPARKEAEVWKQVVAPFEGQMRAEGADPIATVQSLLRTQHTLRNGSPGARAAMVAQIVKAFDVPIQALDEALAGGMQAPQQQQGAPPQAPAEYRDSRLDALLQRAEQQQHAKLQGELQAFMATEPEFLDDVRPHAQALLRGGAAKSLQEAYDMACWASSDIRGILQQREAAKAANATTASTQQARSAASSIRSQPAGATHAPQSKTVEDDVREAWAQLNGR